MTDDIDEADKTPVHNENPYEMVLRKLEGLEHNTKVAADEAREAKGHAHATYDLQLQLNEHVKALDRRLQLVEASRVWLPVAAFLMAALALFRTWFK